jgi:hypothetical protein
MSVGSPFLFVSHPHVMSEYDRSSRASHHLHVLIAPSSGAIHKWIAISRNHALTSYGLSCIASKYCEERPLPQAVNVVPFESHRGWGRSQALASDASKDGVQGVGSEYAGGLTTCQPTTCQPPASVEDPEPSSEDSKDGATRPQEGCIGGPGNASSPPATVPLQAPSSVVTTSISGGHLHFLTHNHPPPIFCLRADGEGGSLLFISGCSSLLRPVRCLMGKISSFCYQ